MRYRSADAIGPEHLGRRVTVRRSLDEGGTADVLGIVEAIDDAAVTLRTASGDAVRIERDRIVASRVHPRPTA